MLNFLSLIKLKNGKQYRCLYISISSDLRGLLILTYPNSILLLNFTLHMRSIKRSLSKTWTLLVSRVSSLIGSELIRVCCHPIQVPARFSWSSLFNISWWDSWWFFYNKIKKKEWLTKILIVSFIYLWSFAKIFVYLLWLLRVFNQIFTERLRYWMLMSR